MTNQSPKKKNPHLKYGEGPREQYGEGDSYRPEDKTKAADKFTEHEFAGGERAEKISSKPRKPEEDGS